MAQCLCFEGPLGTPAASPKPMLWCIGTTAAQVARGHTSPWRPAARHPQLTWGHPPDTAMSPARICGARGGSLLFFICVLCLCTSKDSAAKSTREARSIHISKTRSFAYSPPGGLFIFLPLGGPAAAARDLQPLVPAGTGPPAQRLWDCSQNLTRTSCRVYWNWYTSAEHWLLWQMGIF